jgi:hypothetical protein
MNVSRLAADINLGTMVEKGSSARGAEILTPIYRQMTPA